MKNIMHNFLPLHATKDDTLLQWMAKGRNLAHCLIPVMRNRQLWT